jgi:glycolate oxidase iron-sulfur subunit
MQVGSAGALPVSRPCQLQEALLPEAPPLVAAVADELYKCNRCGFCQTRCPIYRATGRESSVARGHIARLQAAVEGTLPFDDEIRSSLFECLMCRACTAECPPAIETDRAVVAARASYVAEHQSRIQRFIFRRVLASPALLRTGVRVLGWLKRTRLTVFAKLLRLLPWFDRGLSEGPAMMPAPRMFLRDRIARRDTPASQRKQVAYFVGCAIDYAFPEVGEASLDLLEAAGYSVEVAQNACCGLPPYSYGDIESARALARKNLEALKTLGGEAIVTDCASCSSFLKDYPELFEESDPMRAEAEAIASRVRDLSEFLATIELPEGNAGVHAVVTYHDPCHLSRYNRIVREPRELLRRIPGIEYRELSEADWCCGGAGSYALSHHELSMRVLERKMENIRSTGADIVVTPCPACIMQLRYGAAKFGVPVEVVHLTEMLRRAISPEKSVPAPAGAGR